MAAAYGMTAASLTGRLKKGMSLEAALTSPKRKGPGHDCEDHLGNKYQSLSAMCRAYGISTTVYAYRVENCGWDLGTALETPATDTDAAGAHECEDHLGNRFPSKKAMCEYWHVPRNVYFSRKKQGKTLAQCLAPVARRNASQVNVLRDHEGNEFMSLDDMCAHWGILKSQYIQNIRNCLPVSRALTEVTPRPERPRDHTGREFGSINAMCRHWGVTKTMLRSRLELGWTLEQVLTHPEDNSHLIPCKDHLGNEYPSQKAMLAAWHVGYGLYKHRLKKGCTLAEALDPKSRHLIPASDHEGNKFPSLQALMDYWFISTATYHHRTGKQGMDVGTAVTTVLPGQELPGNLKIRAVFGPWLHVSDKSGHYMTSVSRLFEAARMAAMLGDIAAGTLPKAMRAKHVSGPWFQVWNTAGTGPSPGRVMSAGQAWLERCVEKGRQDTDIGE